MGDLPDIEVELTILPGTDGGPGGPMTPGAYRPKFYHTGQDWDARLTFAEFQPVWPGDKVIAFFTFASPNPHVGRVFVGMPFLIRDDRKVSGYGRVTKILDLRRQ